MFEKIRDKIRSFDYVMTLHAEEEMEMTVLPSLTLKA